MAIARIECFGQLKVFIQHPPLISLIFSKIFERTLLYLNTFFTISQLIVHMHELSYINVSTFHIPFIRRLKLKKVSIFYIYL